MNNTIFHQTDICANFHVKTPCGWGGRGDNKKNKNKKDHEKKQ
jgi:hypothetical protein